MLFLIYYFILISLSILHQRSSSIHRDVKLIVCCLFGLWWSWLQLYFWNCKSDLQQIKTLQLFHICFTKTCSRVYSKFGGSRTPELKNHFSSWWWVRDAAAGHEFIQSLLILNGSWDMRDTGTQRFLELLDRFSVDLRIRSKFSTCSPDEQSAPYPSLSCSLLWSKWEWTLKSWYLLVSVLTVTPSPDSCWRPLWRTAPGKPWLSSSPAGFHRRRPTWCWPATPASAGARRPDRTVWAGRDEHAVTQCTERHNCQQSQRHLGILPRFQRICFSKTTQRWTLQSKSCVYTWVKVISCWSGSGNRRAVFAVRAWAAHLQSTSPHDLCLQIKVIKSVSFVVLCCFCLSEHVLALRRLVYTVFEVVHKTCTDQLAYIPSV